MTRHFSRCLCWIGLVPIVVAQEYLGSGPQPPVRPVFAPGQITTVFSTAASSIPELTKATAFPLPQVLGGYSVEFRLGEAGPVWLAPILHVRRYSSCPSTKGILVPCATIAGISIQVPWELSAGVNFGTALMSIVLDGVRGKFADVLVAGTQVRFANGADAAVLERGSLGTLVMHGDGSATTAENPARSGEVLSAYLFGLGIPSGQVVLKSGEPVSEGAELSGLALRYEFRPTQSPEVYPLIGGAGAPLEVRWAGLAPGSVGLYQVNFVIPGVPDGIPECLSGGRGVSSNLTLSLVNEPFAGFGSQAATAICVAPGRP